MDPKAPGRTPQGVISQSAENASAHCIDETEKKGVIFEETELTDSHEESNSVVQPNLFIQRLDVVC